MTKRIPLTRAAFFAQLDTMIREYETVEDGALAVATLRALAAKWSADPAVSLATVRADMAETIASLTASEDAK